MKSFLQYVAQDILDKHGTNLARVAVVFPNKRASLFLSEQLARLSGQPLWSPLYLTISDLFRRQSSLEVADPIKLVCDLHQCFVQQTGIDETLDHFFGWGQLLLADFDDVDKNMADADKVFGSLANLHELDDVTYLTDEQKEIIRRFFSNFSEEHNSELKRRFLQLWSKMGNIYHAFRQKLKEQGIAYEGAIYREVAAAQQFTPEYDTYIFVGFNFLHQAEQQLFARLQQMGIACFYWDYDHYYMKKGTSLENVRNEAGHFIGQYLAHFPNELDDKNADIYCCFERPKQFNLISASTENIQARYISTWLKQENRIADGKKTAIVLCNEALLTTTIYCLPDEVKKVNITTGYPLIQSPAASLVSHLITMQTNGYDKARNRFRLHYVNKVLRHPFIPLLSDKTNELLSILNEQKIYYPTDEQLALDDNLKVLFTPAKDNLELTSWLCKVMQLVAQGEDTKKASPLFQESIFRMYTLMNRLHGLMESGDLHIDVITFERLVNQLINSTSVPFHGDPAEGLQIMGVLETRNLDFEHLLVLSCNEGNMPRGLTDTSFIPYSIRKAYGLTTIDHKVSIYSYYFHRLLSRAHDVTVLYNNSTDEGSTGEMSRFLLQLLVESPHHVNRIALQSNMTYTPFAPQPIEKTAAIVEILQNRFSVNRKPSGATIRPLLTPTAINKYMRCPLIFYYNYVCGLLEPDDNDEDVIDNRIFGNIFHEASRIVYSRLMERSHHILAEDIKEILKKKVDIERAVDEAFTLELFHLKPGTAPLPPLDGLQLINREVIIHYLRQLLTIDADLSPFTIIGLECDVMAPLQTKYLQTIIGGRIDRLDRITEEDGERIRVIDYKTGAKQHAPLPDVSAIFKQEYLDKQSSYYLQTFLYGCIVRSSQQYNRSQLPVSPALLFIQHAATKDYSPILFFGQQRINDVLEDSKEFLRMLTEKVDEVFSPDTAFVPTQDQQRCRMCPYRQICANT